MTTNDFVTAGQGRTFFAGALRGRTYDSMLILGTALLGLTAGAVVLNLPQLFYPVLLIDLWFFGYHHVIATYTRLFFDRSSARQNWFFLTVVPVVVLLVTLTLLAVFDIWAIVTLYLYWQWFHYTRQSWGISRAYARKAGIGGDDWLTKAAFYLLPLWGILYRSWQAPDKFLGLEVKTLPVPGIAVDIVAVAAIVCAAWWLTLRVRAILRGEPPLYTLYAATHFTVFAIGYIVVQDISSGWLIINIWHNAQYLLFVWLYNVRRHGGNTPSGARLLSWMSRPGHWPIYLAVCLAGTAIFYGMITYLANLAFAGLATGITLIFYQAVNFHHYVVDSIIWKLRKAPLQAALGLAPAARPGA
jgi:hypothetical protein